jgi:hypothetical protein
MLLQSLDAVIAFTTVMLVLSLMITAAVQLVISVCGLRGRNLLWGLEELFRRTVPDADRQSARRLAREVLSHGTLSTSTNWLMKALERLLGKLPGKLGEWFRGAFNGGNRPPAALHVNDVKLVLSDLGSGAALAAQLEAAEESIRAASGLDAKSAEELVEILARHLPNQKQALAKAVGELEVEARIAAGAARKTVRSFEDWYELTMDAAAEKLKLHSRWITVAFALLMAFGMRVDTIGILHQLFESPELTAQVLAQTANVQAVSISEKGDDEETRAALTALEGTMDDLAATLDETGLEVFQPFESWNAAWCFYADGADCPPPAADEKRPRILGLLATVLLLSLGGPFWSGALGKLLGFRAIVRERRDKGGGAP